MNKSTNAIANAEQGNGGGGGQPPTGIVFSGGFKRDEVAPTCEGIWDVLIESQTLPRDEFLRSSRAIMDAVWNQSLPPDQSIFPVLKTTADLLDALLRGWAYNANEADTIFMIFADIRPIGRDGKIVGVGTQAPDGAIIHDGRELVAWRERHWLAFRRSVGVHVANARTELRSV